jgi:hypothetical protein
LSDLLLFRAHRLSSDKKQLSCLFNRQGNFTSGRTLRSYRRTPGPHY